MGKAGEDTSSASCSDHVRLTGLHARPGGPSCVGESAETRSEPAVLASAKADGRHGRRSTRLS